MPRPLRRTLLKTVGTLLLASAFPRTGLAGLLDRVFGRPEPKAPGPITPNDEFYVTSYRSPPTIRISEWLLSIKGLVEHPLTLTHEQLIAKPTASEIVTLECVGNTGVGGDFAAVSGAGCWRSCQRVRCSVPGS